MWGENIMAGVSQKVEGSVDGVDEKVDQAFLPYVLTFERQAVHWQICTGSHISRFFFYNRNRLLQKIIPEFNLNPELLSNPVFQEHPIDNFMLYHCGKNCLPLMAERFSSAACLAAFIGNLPALNNLLGEALLEPLDITGCTVMHFLALGGHSKILFKLIESHGVEILKIVDKLGHSVLHFAAIGMNIRLVKILIENYEIPSEQSNITGNNWLDMLADRETSAKNLMILSELIADKEILKETREKLSTDSFDLASLDFIPDFAAQFDITNDESLIQLIIAVTQEIATHRKSHFDPYLCYLLAYKQLKTELRHNNTGSLEI